jgi:hypothetical protein
MTTTCVFDLPGRQGASEARGGFERSGSRRPGAERA